MRIKELVPVYENMLQLYSAAWLIHKRAKWDLGERSSLRSKSDKQNDKAIEIEPVILKEPIRAIIPNLTAAQKLGLDEVISVITKKVLPVESITLLGTHPYPFTFYLVILLNDHDKLVEHEIANRIEDICRPLVSIITIVHKGNSARSGINSGNRFWNHTFSKGLNVYAASGFELPEYQMLEADVYKDKVTTDWERWGGQGKAFLKGAHYYLGIELYAGFVLTASGSRKYFDRHNQMRTRLPVFCTQLIKDAPYHPAFYG